MQSSKINFSEHPFLRFASKLIEQKEPHDILLNLQKNYRLNNNMVLYCCWFGSSGYGRLNSQQLFQLLATITTWHERIVLALNQLLISLKVDRPWVNEITQQVDKEIQAAETIERLLLSEVSIKGKQTTATASQKLMDTCRNIVAYCRIQQLGINPSLSELFYQLVAAAFPKIDLQQTHETNTQIFLHEEKNLSYSQPSFLFD